MKPNLTEEILREFEEADLCVQHIHEGSMCYHNWTILSKGKVKKFLTYAIDKAYRAGRASILEELNHEQQKFVDGFRHPTDCKICASLNTTK